MSNPIFEFEDFTKITTPEEIRRGKDFLRKKRTIAEATEFVKEVKTRGKGNKENLVIFLRRHWINLFFELLPFLFFTFLLLASYLAIIFFLPNTDYNSYQVSLTNFLLALASLFVWAFLFIILIDYYLDVWIVTDERIVDIEQRGLFRREVSELLLENIQDLTTEITGVIPTVFDYGNLYIQTAGKRERFQFQSIPHPERVRDLILVLSEEKRGGGNK